MNNSTRKVVLRGSQYNCVTWIIKRHTGDAWVKDQQTLVDILLTNISISSQKYKI